MSNERELSRLSYRELQALAARHRVPGNIKKNVMIKVILAAGRGDEPEVTRLLNELQQTRKKRIKKIKKEKKIGIKSLTNDNNDYQANKYYAHQQQSSFNCAPNLQILTQEEMSNVEVEHLNISNYDDVHEYLVRVQRDCHSNINNNNNINECATSPSIVDLRMNGQKSFIHQSLPLDLHRTTNILLKTTDYTNDDINKNKYNHHHHHYLNSNDTLQAPLLLKKMLQAPVGTNLQEIVSPNSIYRVYSRNNFPTNNIFDDSDTLSAESESNANDDFDDNDDNYYRILNTDKNTFINIEQNIIDDSNIQELNSFNQNLSLTDSEHYRIVHQSTDNQQKWMQDSAVTFTNSIEEIQQDNGEILKTIYYTNQSNMQTNQLQYQTIDNSSAMTNENDNAININSNNSNNNDYYYYYNNSRRIESSNSSSQQTTCNYQSDNSLALLNNNNITENNHDDIYYSHQNRCDDAVGYNSQGYNVNDPEVFNNIYHNVDATPSQQFNNNDIVNITESTNKNDIDNSRCNNDDYYYHDIYLQNCQMDFNVDHNMQTLNNNIQQTDKHREYQELGENPINNSADLQAYFPCWRQSNVTPAVIKNLENLLNIRKLIEPNQIINDETSSVFCYSTPIITPKQLNTNENVCTQEKRCYVEKRNNSLLKINSNQVYSDTAQGQKMSNVIEDINLNTIDQLDVSNNDYFSSNEQQNTRQNDSNTTLRDIWTVDNSNPPLSSDKQTKTIESE